MDKQILVTYKSVTGYTEQYAKWIAEALGCPAAKRKDVTAKTMSAYRTVIFGGRLHAGSVDGLKKVKKAFAESGAAELILFAVGAAPQNASQIIEDTWKNNLTADEAERYPHFYMQGGLRYDKMPLGDKLMIKIFTAMLRGKGKEKSEYEAAMLQTLEKPCDGPEKENILPLLSYVTGRGQGK